MRAGESSEFFSSFSLSLSVQVGSYLYNNMSGLLPASLPGMDSNGSAGRVLNFVTLSADIVLAYPECVNVHTHTHTCTHTHTHTHSTNATILASPILSTALRCGTGICNTRNMTLQSPVRIVIAHPGNIQVGGALGGVALCGWDIQVGGADCYVVYLFSSCVSKLLL